MSFKLWLEQDAMQTLMALRPHMAAAAQQVYDAWDQSDEHDEYNGGGICQDIAEAIADVIYSQFPGDNYNAGTVSAQCGEQHVWVIMTVGGQGFEIDVPYSMYERGGGYTWQKIQGVKFEPNDIIIAPMDHQDAANALDDPY
jgi:hypothetical protein